MKQARECVDFVASAGILFGNCRSRKGAELLLLAERWASRGRRRGADSGTDDDGSRRKSRAQPFDELVRGIVGVPGPRLHCISLLLLDLEIYAGIYVRRLWGELARSFSYEFLDGRSSFKEDSGEGSTYSSEFQDNQESSRGCDTVCVKYKML